MRRIATFGGMSLETDLVRSCSLRSDGGYDIQISSVKGTTAWRGGCFPLPAVGLSALALTLPKGSNFTEAPGLAGWETDFDWVSADICQAQVEAYNRALPRAHKVWKENGLQRWPRIRRAR